MVIMFDVSMVINGEDGELAWYLPRTIGEYAENTNVGIYG